jgi:hypothetical protein
MAGFEYQQATEIRDALARHQVRYLFLGKSGAILLGYPDTTQDADIFPEKSPQNGRALALALKELGFELTELEVEQIQRGKDFVQLKNGPFDMDLIFAPDGIERFEDAWSRRVIVEGFPVCHPDDIIASKAAANRVKDRESLERLKAFREYWKTHREKS